MNATPETKQRPVSLSALKTYWGHARRHPWFLSISFGAVIITSLVGVFVPVYYKKFFDILVITPELLTENVSVVLWVLVSIFGLELLRWGAWRLVDISGSRVQPKITTEILGDAFAKLIRHSFGFFQDTFVGSLTRRLTRFGSAFDVLLDQAIYTLVPILISIVGILIVVHGRSPAIMWFMLTWIVVFVYITYRVFRWKQSYEIERSEADSKVTGAISDTVTNTTTIKTFSGFAHEGAIFAGVLETLQRIRTKIRSTESVIWGAQGLLTIIIELGIMGAAVYLYQRGSLTVGDFVLFQAYISTIVTQVWAIGRVLRGGYSALADAHEMVEILEKPYDIQDIPNAQDLHVSHGEIIFKDVSFAFNETRTVFKNLSFAIAPQEKIAFVGPSGAGKSTITKLLFRFYDVMSGTIMIDEQNIAHVTQDSLRDAIALVAQEPILFHRSLMDNIRYGRLDATNEEVYEAAKKAHCHDFISALSGGYDTLVGERGVKLSGGERQRIAIARAILKNAPILILDEATSSLDSESEHLIQDALKVLMEGKTVIVIAHRLSTIMKMDRILVVEDGTIRASGKHEELLKKDDLYKKLWSIQVGGFLQ